MLGIGPDDGLDAALDQCWTSRKASAKKPHRQLILRNLTAMKHLHIGAILALLVLATVACQTSRLALPTHNEPPGTDRGGNYLAGELRVEDGCMKLYRMGWDDPDRAIGQQIRDIWLPLWPVGFALRQDGEEIQVINSNGATMARAGDTVRLAGGSYWSDEIWQQEMESTVPEACRDEQGLLYYLIGDEISVVPENEATAVPLQGSTLWFPRNRTSGSGPPKARMLAAPPREQTLVLDGDCLRIGEDGPVVVWPAGFYPDTVDGRVVVRNGGGQVVAVVGHQMKLDSGGYIPGGSGSCRGPLWGGTRFLEVPAKP